MGMEKISKDSPFLKALEDIAKKTKENKKDNVDTSSVKEKNNDDERPKS